MIGIKYQCFLHYLHGKLEESQKQSSREFYSHLFPSLTTTFVNNRLFVTYIRNNLFCNVRMNENKPHESVVI